MGPPCVSAADPRTCDDVTLAGLFLSCQNCVRTVAGTESPAGADADPLSESVILELLTVDAGIDGAGAGVSWFLEIDNGDGLLRHDVRFRAMQFYRVENFFYTVSARPFPDSLRSLYSSLVF